MSRSGQTLLALLCAFAQASAALPVQAQQTGGAPSVEARARELYENGKRLFDEGEFDDAVLAWEEAYRLSNRSALLFNLALAHEQLGDLRKALDYLQRYRAFVTSADRADVEARVASLRARIAQQEQQQEQQRAQAHAAAAEGSGAAHAAEPSPAPTPPVTSPPTPVATPAPAAPPMPVDKTPLFDTVEWSLLGGAGAGLLMGVTFGAIAVGETADLEDNCRQTTDGWLCLDDQDALIDSEARDRAFADVGFGLALASGAGFALYRYLWKPDPDGAQLSLSPNGVWVSVPLH